MISFGNVPAGSVLPVFFDAFSGSTGASITISGLAVTDIEIYKGTSMTQRASDNGYALMDTDGIDLDGVTGIHGFSIDTSDNSDSGFYAAGSFYTVVVSAVTIDSQTVSFVAATFRLVAAENTAGTPAVDAVRLGGTAQTGRDVGASVLLSAGTGTGQLDFTSGVVKSNVTQFGGTNATTSGGRPEVNTTHAAGTAWASGAITAAVLAADAITAAKVASDVGTEIATAVWGAGTRQLTGTQTFDLTGNITGNLSGSVGSVSGNVGGNVTGSVGSVAAGGITASSIAADAITAAKVASDVTTELQSGLATAANLATVAGYIDTEMDAVLAVAKKLDTALESDGSGGYQFTTLALENAPAGGGGGTDWTTDEKAVIRAVLGIPGSGTTPADPSTGILDTIRDAVAGVQSDTDNIQTRLPAALVSGRMDVSVGAYQSGLAPLDAAGTRAAVGLASANLDTQLSGLLAPWSATLTESYAANGAAFTLAQGLYAIHQRLMDFAIVGTTVTVRELDGASTAFAITLDSDTTPTESTRA